MQGTQPNLLALADALERKHATGVVAAAIQIIVDTCRELYTKAVPAPPTGPHTPTHVTDWIVARLGIRKTMRGSGTNANARLRAIGAFVVWHLTDASQAELARQFGWANQSTAWNALNRIETTPELRAQAMEEIREYKNKYPKPAL